MGKEDKEYTWNLIAKKLSGEASPQELQELEQLLRGNPELHYPMQTLTDLWHSCGPGRQAAAEKAFDRHLDRMTELNVDFTSESSLAEPVEKTSHEDPSFLPLSSSVGKYPKRRRFLLFAAPCVLLTIGLALLVFRTGQGKRPLFPNTAILPGSVLKEVRTDYGSRTHLVLPDGTRVWLNAGSRITYNKNYAASLREVSLTGEAFFDVARNAEKPFVIHTDRIDIKVLGTRFNIRSYPADKTTETTLLRGSIEVSIKDRPSEKIILKPNEKLIVANDDSTLHRPGRMNHGSAGTGESLVTIRKPTYDQETGAIIETSWVDNKLIFREEEFGELSSQMERWYGVTIRFGDPGLEQLRFTGSFKGETIEQALNALKLTATFNYTIESNQILITK
jgi:transmembrane sensor